MLVVVALALQLLLQQRAEASSFFYLRLGHLKLETFVFFLLSKGATNVVVFGPLLALFSISGFGFFFAMLILQLFYCCKLGKNTVRKWHTLIGVLFPSPPFSVIVVFLLI
jgi:hypothetical protein